MNIFVIVTCLKLFMLQFVHSVGTTEVIVVTGIDTYDSKNVIEVFDFNTRQWNAVEKIDTDNLSSEESRKFSYRATVQRLPGRARLVENNDVIEYTLSNGVSKKLADYPEEASGATVLEYGDTVCLVGGYDSNNRVVRKSVHCWNPLAMTSSPPASSSSSRRRSSGWVALPEMTVGRFRPGAVVMDGKMYVAGGKDPVSHKDLDSMEVFDDVTQKWYLMTSRLSAGRTAFQLLAVRGKLYAIGGWSDYKFLNTVEEYDPIPDRWRARASMAAGPRAKFGSVVTRDGTVYVVGGIRGLDLGHNTNRVEVYTPGNDTWSQSELPPLSVISGPVRATLVEEDGLTTRR